MEQTEATQKKLLLVEDDSFILDIYDVKLSEAGYDVTLASNGREAVKQLKEHQLIPDLILLDIVMPYMDGFDVLKVLKENDVWKEIPIIMLTNLSQKDDIERAVQMGANDYLIKSHFTPSEVLTKIQKYI